MALNGERDCVIAILDAEILWSEQQFGSKNPLVTHLVQTKLAVLVRQLLAGEQAVGVMILGAIARLCDLQFGVTTVKLGLSASCSNLKTYSFSQRHFEHVYADTGTIWRKRIASSLLWSDAHDGLQERFIYVIGPAGEWRYYPYPQPLEVSVTRRGDPKVFPFHPMLALDFDLEVSVAGEIAFQWKQGDQFPEAAYVNNISGHFKPDEWSAAELDRALRRSLGLPATTGVIAIANDGAHVSGRLAALLEGA